MSGSRRRRHSIGALALAALLVAAGCSDGESGEATTEDAAPAANDEALITALATDFVTASDDPRTCTELATPGLVTAIFGDVETCERVSSTPDDGEDATDAAVTSIVVNGDTATANVKEIGGDTDGATGKWTFARGGDGWQISEFSIDYLRSIVAVAFGPNYESDGPEDPFADAAFRNCVRSRFLALDDQRYRAIVYSLIAERDDADATLEGFGTDCVAASEQTLTETRRNFEEGFRSSIPDDFPSEVADCVLLTLRELVTDAEIEAAENDPSKFEEFEQLGADVTQDCLEQAQGVSS
ncbi:MAG: hypothetical protein ACT4PP_17565 [Sporichthyaceae bacterium]